MEQLDSFERRKCTVCPGPREGSVQFVQGPGRKCTVCPGPRKEIYSLLRAQGRKCTVCPGSRKEMYSLSRAQEGSVQFVQGPLIQLHYLYTKSGSLKTLF